MPDGRRVCVASEWKLRSNPSSAAVSMTGSPKPSSMASPKPSSTSSPKMYSPPMPSPMQAPNRAPLPPSMEEAALKLEAGQRNALEAAAAEAEAAAAATPQNLEPASLEEELQEWEAAATPDAAATATPQKVLEAAPQKPVEVCQATDLQAWQAKEIDLRRVWVRNHKFDFLLVLAVGGGGGLVAGVVGGALLALLVESFLHAWHAKRLALYRACHVKGLAIPDYRALANKELLEALLAAGGAVLLAIFLFRFFVAGSGEQPAPEPVALECLWRWKAFRCLTGCKPRMHWPGLQGACTPM